MFLKNLLYKKWCYITFLNNLYLNSFSVVLKQFYVIQYDIYKYSFFKYNNKNKFDFLNLSIKKEKYF